MFQGLNMHLNLASLPDITAFSESATISNIGSRVIAEYYVYSIATKAPFTDMG